MEAKVGREPELRGETLPLDRRFSDRADAMAGATRAGSRGGVLCVANYPSDTGYAWWLMEHLWTQIGRATEAHGGTAFVAFPQVSTLSPRLQRAPLQVVELRVPTELGGGLEAVRRFIRENRIRTVYFTDRPYWSPTYALFRSWGVRSVIIHDHVPGEPPRPPRSVLLAKRAIHSARVFSADLYIGVSQFVCDRFQQVGGLPAHLCACVRNGIPGRIRGSNTDLHCEFGIPEGATTVVSSGRVTTYKGIDFLVRCAARLIKEEGRSNLYFLHLGDGPDRQRFERQVEDLELRSRFIFAGARSDVSSLLPSCSVALHASNGEAFSLAILEFMAAGLPTIAPNHCGNGEAIESEVSGLLYAPGDLRAATASVGRLLDDPILGQRLGEAAQRRAEREFTLEDMDQRFRAAVERHLIV